MTLKPSRTKLTKKEKGVWELNSMLGKSTINMNVI